MAARSGCIQLRRVMHLLETLVTIRQKSLSVAMAVLTATVWSD